MDRARSFAASLAVVLVIAGAPASPLAAHEVPEPAAPQEPAAEPADEPSEGAAVRQRKPAGDWLRMHYAADEWTAARENLAARGFSLEIAYTQVWQKTMRGGLDSSGAGRHTGSYDLALTVDTAKAGLWPGGQIYAYLEGAFQYGVSEPDVGDLLGVNADAQTAGDTQLSMLWYGHRFLDDRLLVRVGRIDATSDFDTSAYANDEVMQFLNSALVNNPAIPFPDYALGLQVVVTPVEWAYYVVGVFDAEAMGGRTGFDTAMHGPARFFLIQEAGVTPVLKSRGRSHPGAYRVGTWYNPLTQETFLPRPGSHEPGLRTDDWGLYLSFDQLVWKENSEEEDEQGLGLFFRYGFAHEDVNAIEHFYSWGASYKGLIPGRDEDVLGAGFAWASLSDAWGRADPGIEREAVVELFYNIHVTEWLQITPDVQVAIDPGGREGGRDAIVAGVRLGVFF